MSRRRRNETEEQRARRELISDFLSAANIQSMDDIQELFKEALAGFMEGSLESELDSELGYEPYEPAIWLQATVGNDYLVSDGKNKYSVPFDLII